MKTKEEIVKWHTHNLSAFSLATYKKPVYDAMQEYADQECAAKDNEISRLNGIITEQQRLSNLVSGDLQNAKKEIQELREGGESLRNEKNNELARLTAPDGAITKRVLIEDNHKLTSEIEQLRKENEELRAKLDRRWIRTADQMPNEQALLLTSSQDIIIGDWYKEAWRTHRSKWVAGILESAYKKDDIVAWQLLPFPGPTNWIPAYDESSKTENWELRELQSENQSLRSQQQTEQLRKENEEWKKRQEYLEDEITRLRELLTKAKDYIFLGYVGAVELSDEIDNALNPKP